jgi:hypothetical protein
VPAGEIADALLEEVRALAAEQAGQPGR